MAQIIYVAFFGLAIFNLCLLALADRAKGWDIVFTFLSICLHYEAILRLFTGYHVVFDVATRSTVYALCNTFLILYWAGAFYKYYKVIREFMSELRRFARLRTLQGQNDL